MLLGVNPMLLLPQICLTIVGSFIQLKENCWSSKTPSQGPPRALGLFQIHPWLWGDSLQNCLDTGKPHFAWQEKKVIKSQAFTQTLYSRPSSSLDWLQGQGQMHTDHLSYVHIHSAYAPGARQSAGGYTLPPDFSRLCHALWRNQVHWGLAGMIPHPLHAAPLW